MRPDIVCEPVSRNDVILGLVALVLVVFSLLVSLVAPRRWPDFPGNRLGAFTAVALLLVVAMLAAVEIFGEGHASAEGEAAHVEDAGHEEEAAEDGETDGDTGAGTGGDAARGAEVYAEAGCGGCHVLEAAGTTSTVGPNLDDARPTFEQAVAQITNGGGAMPAFRDRLSEEDIRAVATYVVESTQ
jgi:mono/diheme cytochrome c family protein